MTNFIDFINLKKLWVSGVRTPCFSLGEEPGWSWAVGALCDQAGAWGRDELKADR